MSGMSVSNTRIMIVENDGRGGMRADAFATRAEAAEKLIRAIDAWTWEEPNGTEDLTRIMNLCKGKLLTRARMAGIKPESQ